MTKELSKQICEICEMEPETLTVNRGFTKKEVEAYPDFGEPENFMKLLEIISRKAGVLFCHNGVYFGCSVHYGFDEKFEAIKGNLAKNFLNTLIVQHDKNSYYPKLFELEEIKQVIREAEWKYE